MPLAGAPFSALARVPAEVWRGARFFGGGLVECWEAASRKHAGGVKCLVKPWGYTSYAHTCAFVECWTGAIKRRGMGGGWQAQCPAPGGELRAAQLACAGPRPGSRVNFRAADGCSHRHRPGMCARQQGETAVPWLSSVARHGSGWRRSVAGARLPGCSPALRSARQPAAAQRRRPACACRVAATPQRPACCSSLWLRR